MLLLNFENRWNSLFHSHAVFSPLIFFSSLPCSPLSLPGLFSFYWDSAQAPSLLPDIHPANSTTLQPNTSVNTIIMALIPLLLQLFMVPSLYCPLTIKTMTFKDLCFLCDGYRYRLSAYYKPAIILETWTHQWTKKKKKKKKDAHEADMLTYRAYCVCMYKYKFYTLHYMCVNKRKKKVNAYRSELF